jgi:hypothetical protein
MSVGGPIIISHTIYECGQPRWNYIDRDNRRTRRKTCPIVILFTTNPTWTDGGENQRLRCERPALKHLSHGIAASCEVIN